MDEKLQKVLARAGEGSRREMETCIREGKVFVNGVLATLGDRVQITDVIELNGHPVKFAEAGANRRVIIYNKPEGEVCTRKDPEGRSTVFDRLPKLQGERWIAVGRLDINTSGLLLFTTDGELANRLMHPSTQIDREYLVRVMGSVTDDNISALKKGVLLDDGMAKFTDIVDGGGEGINHWYYVCVMEGRNREVRRLWESQGLKVNRLKRVRFGPVFLPSKAKVGCFVDMDEAEANALCELVGITPNDVKTKTQQQKVDAKRQKGKSVTARKAKGFDWQSSDKPEFKPKKPGKRTFR